MTPNPPGGNPPGGGGPFNPATLLFARQFVRIQQEVSDQTRTMTANFGALAAGLDVLGNRFEAAVQALGRMGRATQEAATQTRTWSKDLADLGRGGATVFGALQASLGGWALSGIRASAVGQHLGFMFSELARQAGSIFVPQLQVVSKWLLDVIGWFRGLDGAAQQNIARWALWTAGLSGAAMVLPKLVSGLTAVGTALKVLNAHPLVLLASVLTAALVSSQGLEGTLKGLTGLFERLGDAVGPAMRNLGDILKNVGDALAEVIDKLKELSGLKEAEKGKPNLYNLERNAEAFLREYAGSSPSYGSLTPDWLLPWAELGKTLFIGPGATIRRLMGDEALEDRLREMDEFDKIGKKKRTELPPRIGGLESPDQTWERISLAAMRATLGAKDPAEETAQNTGWIKEAIDDIKGMLSSMLPRPEATR